MKVEIYSDVVCPWCYVGERRFESALAQFSGRDDVEIVFRPYQLDPTAPEAGIPLRQYLEHRFGRPAGDMLTRVTENAAGEGITIDWDAAIAANTRNAHRLLGLAEREYGVAMQRKLVDALFDAHFSRGANIGDVETLSNLAESVGIDRARAHAYLAANEGAAELERAFREARELGVNSVPTFVFDELYAVQGAQPTDTFVQVLEEVKSRSTAQVEK